MSEISNLLFEVPVFNLKDLTARLKETIESGFSHIRVRAEISGLKRHTSGHIYFCLKDEDCVLDAVCWRGSLGDQRSILADGLEVIATGRLTIYGGRSKYQMVVEAIEPTGEGALLKLLQARKAALAAEGLFDQSQKKPLPRLPRCIGIVTSPTGAVIQDILHRLQDRYPCEVLLWPVAVQGTGAAEAIAAAINGFQALKPDVLIIARGGGSLEDLWAFNEEIVVRAAAASRIPLISGVGHETDTTLIDYAADVRAPTPTAAAELATPLLLRDLWLGLSERQQRLNTLLFQLFEHQQIRLQGLTLQRLDPRRLIEEKTQRLDDWCERWVKACQIGLERWYRAFETLAQRLEQGSYKKILERGFAWVTNLKGETISTKTAIQPSQVLRLTFVDGSVVVKVEGNVSKSKKLDISQPQLF